MDTLHYFVKIFSKMVNLFNYICGGVCQVDIYDLYLYFQRSVSFENKEIV